MVGCGGRLSFCGARRASLLILIGLAVLRCPTLPGVRGVLTGAQTRGSPSCAADPGSIRVATTRPRIAGGAWAAAVAVVAGGRPIPLGATSGLATVTLAVDGLSASAGVVAAASRGGPLAAPVPVVGGRGGGRRLRGLQGRQVTSRRSRALGALRRRPVLPTIASGPWARVSSTLA